jgi:hypothetical protein
LHRLVGLYVRESFAGVELDDEERDVLRASLRSVSEAIRADGKKSRPSSVAAPASA